MRKKYKIEDLSFTNEAVFSEIDLKETSFKKKKDIELYSLNVLSDTEIDENEYSSNGSNVSINLDDYDLDIDTETEKYTDNNDLNTNEFFKCLLEIDSKLEKIEENSEEENSENSEEEISEDEASEEKISKNIEKKVNKKNNKNIKKNKDFKVKYINEISDLVNVTPENLIVKKLNTENIESKLNETKNELNTTISELNTTKSELNETKVKLEKLEEKLSGTHNEIFENKLTENITDNLSETFNKKIIKNLSEKLSEQINEKLSEQINEKLSEQINDKLSEQINDKLSEQISDKLCEQQSENIKKSEKIVRQKELKELNTEEKNKLIKYAINENVIDTSYNYSQCESQNNYEVIDNIKMKDFFNIAIKENKNIVGYIEDDNIHKCKIKKPYTYEIYTKIDNNIDKDPPGNYINKFLKKDLNILKKIFLLQKDGYWIMEPLNNFKKFKEEEHLKDILNSYFIILKLLYYNKQYPFTSGDIIKKYKNLTKTINLNLILNYINKNTNFKEYVNNQLLYVFKLDKTIDNIIDLIKNNNMNKQYSNILKLNYVYY